MSIETYGVGERLRYAEKYSRALGISRHILLLPVPTSRDKVFVSGTDIPLEQTLLGVGKESIVVGYALPAAYKEEALLRGAHLLDLAEEESFLLENAKITALDTIGYVLVTEKRALCDLFVGIVGYGRIGSILARELLFLGARVRVYSKRLGVCLELSEAGVDAVAMMPAEKGGCDFSEIDLLINTAPTDMTGYFPFGKREDLRILELASGKNFEGIDGVEPLPSLPEKMHPDSAGRIYFSALSDFIRKIERHEK